MPERSRHCEGSEAARMSLGSYPGKAQLSDEPSQENCLFDNHRLTRERWEGDLFFAFVRLDAAHVGSFSLRGKGSLLL